MKKLIFVFSVLLFAGCVLASVYISEPSDVYNLGDRMYIDLGGLRGAENGNLDVNLKCKNQTINMVRIPARAFSSEDDQTYSVPYKILNSEDLGISDLSSIVSECQIFALIGDDIGSTKLFRVSNNVNVKLSLDKLEYNPGEEVFVEVSAVKDNGVVLDGFFDGSNASFFSGEIIGGVSGVSFMIPSTSESGVYNLNVHAYDEEGLNDGEGSIFYSVNQVATSLVLSFSDNFVVPGENFSVGVSVFDQSGIEMSGSVFISVISPEGERFDRVVEGGEFFDIDLPSNSSVGTWTIVSEFGNLVQSREFEVEALQKVEFEFEDSVLVIKNVGNVLYNKTIDVNIGENVMTLDLNIEVGGVRKFVLEAPMGEYDVVVGDGDYMVGHRIMLTGNAVSISDFENVGILRNYSVVWIFLIVVLGGIGGVLIMRYRKTRTFGGGGSWVQSVFEKIRKGGHKSVVSGRNLKKKVENKVPSSIRDNSLNFTNKSPAVQGFDSSSYSSKDKTMVDLTHRGLTGAESSLVLKGEKHVSGVVALSIKNNENLAQVARESLTDIVEKFKGKGLVDYRGEYIFVVFSPLVTRTYGNEGLAVKCAMNIINGLTVYNKKFKDKIEFGIGVHSGDLIMSKEGGKLRYTGIGNTISFAKRMGDIDSGKVVISDIVRKKLIRDLKVAKGKEIGEKVTWVVSEVMDRSGDAERLRQLMKRKL